MVAGYFPPERPAPPRASARARKTRPDALADNMKHGTTLLGDFVIAIAQHNSGYTNPCPPRGEPKMRFQFTIRDLLWLFVVIALVLAWRIDRPRVQQWEYKTMPTGASNTVDFLNKYGAEGWEGFAVDPRTDERKWGEVLLKRPKR